MSCSGPSVFLRTTAPSRPSEAVAARFQACVRNTGNYFFESALLRQLTGVEIAGCLEELPQSVGKLVLSMSNFLSETTDLGYVAEALERLDIAQIVMIGAGAQAYRSDDRIRLTDGTVRFLALVAERSVTIGVRGAYTADVLAKAGITNVEVIGCPAAFWSGSVPVQLRRHLPPRPRLAIHATPLGHFRDKVSALMAHGIRYGANYIMQSEAWMLPLLEGRLDDSKLVNELLYYAYPECDVAALSHWLSEHVRMFFDMGEWIGHMGRYDFVYGSRFHGNLAAIQAGVPALSLPFDTRTRELCDYLNLPSLPLVQFDSEMSVERLYDYADFSLFERTYPLKRQAYTAFLDRNGLAHTLHGEGPPPAPPEPCVTIASLRRLLRDLERVGASDADACRQIAGRLWADRTAAGRHSADIGRLEDLCEEGLAG